MIERSERKLWTEEETILALYLYFQLPFGKLHQRTPEVKALAEALGRKDGSVAMKLVNFASLDPKITGSGRKGLDGASKLDRAVYAKFGQNWNALVERASELWRDRVAGELSDGSAVNLNDKRSEFRFEPYSGASVSHGFVAQRVGQGFFRRAVLANFNNCCCITGIDEPRLLIASHISPWGADVENRHNPRNGLCLSATFDRAFDAHLMTATPDLEPDPKLS